MKKIISVVVAFVAALLFAVPATTQAASGAITPAEQSILTTLDAGATVGGKTFHITAADRTQAVNYLKAHDVSDAKANKVASQIAAAIALVEAQDVDTTNIHTLTQLMKAMPIHVKNQVKNIIANIGGELGLVVTVGRAHITLVDPTTNAEVYTTGDAVKQTGSAAVISLVVLGAMLTIAAGAFVAGKKVSVA